MRFFLCFFPDNRTPLIFTRFLRVNLSATFFWNVFLLKHEGNDVLGRLLAEKEDSESQYRDVLSLCPSEHSSQLHPLQLLAPL